MRRIEGIFKYGLRIEGIIKWGLHIERIFRWGCVPAGASTPRLRSRDVRGVRVCNLAAYILSQLSREFLLPPPRHAPRSGTLSYIFNELSPPQGKTFSEVVWGARRRGYTEPDPREDLSGGWPKTGQTSVKTRSKLVNNAACSFGQGLLALFSRVRGGWLGGGAMQRTRRVGGWRGRACCCRRASQPPLH